MDIVIDLNWSLIPSPMDKGNMFSEEDQKGPQTKQVSLKIK